MNKKDIVIGAVVLAILGGVLYVRSRNSNSDMRVPEAQTQGSSTEQALEDKFNTDIPDDAPKAELSSVDGGDGSGIATKVTANGTTNVMILADLPAPTAGMVYQGWLVKGDEGSDDYHAVSAGRLTSAKGGYTLNFQSKTDYSVDHAKVVISEEKSGATSISKAILSGNF